MATAVLFLIPVPCLITAENKRCLSISFGWHFWYYKKMGKCLQVRYDTDTLTAYLVELFIIIYFTVPYEVVTGRSSFAPFIKPKFVPPKK